MSVAMSGERPGSEGSASAPRAEPRRRARRCIRRGFRARLRAARRRCRRFQLGLELLAAGLEGVGDVLEEEQAKDDVLVLGGVQRPAQLIGCGPKGIFKANTCFVCFRFCHDYASMYLNLSFSGQTGIFYGERGVVCPVLKCPFLSQPEGAVTDKQIFAWVSGRRESGGRNGVGIANLQSHAVSK